MQYIVSSRGRPIGTTDLDFIRIDGSNRSGWFHPNALGQELMPSIASPLPAMRAYTCRNARDMDGRSLLKQDFRNSTVFADLAEAFHTLEALELTLHHADGTPIPISEIGIQDTEALLELGRGSDLLSETDYPGNAEWDEDPGLDAAVAHDLELLAADWDDSDDDLDDIWIAGDDEPSALPRYQVHVMLAEENAIP